MQTDSSVDMGIGVSMTTLPELTQGEEAKDDACTLKKLENHDMTGYELEESIWDATVLIGAHVEGSPGRPAAGAFSAMLVVINLLIQSGLGVAVVIGFTTPVYTADGVTSLRAWRRNVAHDIKYMDIITQNSLAERVCAGESGLAFGNSQATQYSDVTAYLNQNVGVIMCVLALTVWIMSIVNDLSHTISLHRAVYEVWDGAVEETSLKYDEDGEIVITAVSTSRMLCVTLVLLARVGVATMLLYAGSLWLVYTASLQDLMLNAVALEFVLNVDEAIYATLAPLSLKANNPLIRP